MVETINALSARQLIRRMRYQTPQGRIEMHVLAETDDIWWIGVAEATGYFQALGGQNWRFTKRSHTYRFWKLFKAWAQSLTPDERGKLS